MENIIIYGFGGHGKLVADLAKQIGFNVTFWDDNIQVCANNFNVNYPTFLTPKDSKLFIGIGDNKIRQLISCRYPKESFVTLIHPSAVVSLSTSISIGDLIMPGVIVNIGSVLGEHCILNSGSVIEHDCYLGNYVHISPNSTLCGNVKIGEGTHIGAGATILPNVKIGKWCLIGAGAVITKDIPDNSLVVGVPGKIIKTFKNA